MTTKLFKKVFILFVILVIIVSIYFYRPAKVLAYDNTRLRVDGHNDYLTAICDTGNGVMIYVSKGLSNSFLAVVPNGCNKK